MSTGNMDNSHLLGSNSNGGKGVQPGTDSFTQNNTGVNSVIQGQNMNNSGLIGNSNQMHLGGQQMMQQQHGVYNSNPGMPNSQANQMMPQGNPNAMQYAPVNNNPNYRPGQIPQQGIPQQGIPGQGQQMNTHYSGYSNTNGSNGGGQQQQYNGMHPQMVNIQGSMPSSLSQADPNQMRTWQNSGADYSSDRAAMATRIIDILQQRRPNASNDWQQKLPQMAKRLEEALFMKAVSFDEYMDQSTTKQRLQLLAQSMGAKKDAPTVRTGNPQQGPGGPSQQQMLGNAVQHPQSQVPQIRMNPTASQMLPSSMIGQPGYNNAGYAGNQGYPNQGQGQGGNGGANSGTGMNMNMGHPGMHAGHGYPDGSGGGMNQGPGSMPGNGKMKIDMAKINPMLVAAPVNKSVGPGAMGSMQGQQGAGQPMDIQMMMQQQPGGSQLQVPGGNQAANRTHHSEEHRKQVLKQQQQRLLLLRHASKCPHEANKCTVTPHCASMKELWSHIMSCKDQECKVPHCVSSRYVLSHYSKCKDASCPVCGPVREAIRRNYERSNSVINSGKRNMQQVQEGYGGVVPSKNSAFNSSNVPISKKARMDMSASVQAMQGNKQALTVSMKSQNPVLDPISCPLYCLTTEEINAHIKGIHEGVRITATSIKAMTGPIVDFLLNLPHVFNLFSVAVDPVALGLPDYFEFIKSPMDLGTIKKKLEGNNYRDLDEFAKDVRLTFNNAMQYNAKTTDVYGVAKNSLKEFEGKFKLAVTKYEAEINAQRSMSDYCMVCGEKVLRFEPPVYYCNGRCGLKIRRGSNFYASMNNAYHWCSQCFNELGDHQSIPLPDCTLTKADLAPNKKKHTEESEEPWVACDGCDGWVHQLCVLFNTRKNDGEVPFLCPTCVIAKRAKGMEVLKTDRTFKASDLPHSNLSSFLEKRINQVLERGYESESKKLGIPLSEVERAPALSLRQVASLDKSQTVREGVLERYKHKKFPLEFPCRTKCLILFQNIDGQDVLLFGMYVYEYGHKCPQPNQRRVYISYLDSVHYFRPRQYRTLVYHEIIVAYLEYVKVRGFHTAHIWACPPLKGDDYILYCHPNDQKNPKDDRLRKWYVDMLDECKKRGIVLEVADIFSTYMENAHNDCTVMPYFEGDYWVNEAEVIIKDLASKKPPAGLSYSILSNSIESADQSKAKGRSKSKAKGRGAGAVATTSSQSSPVPSSTPVMFERDAVMAKLASIIEPMKEAFFVVRLLSKEYAELKAKQRLEEIGAEEATSATSEQTEESKEVKEKKLQEEILSESSTVQIRDIEMMNKKAKSVQTRYKTRRSASSNALSSMDGEDDEEESEEKALSRAEDNAESETLREMELELEQSSSALAQAESAESKDSLSPVPDEFRQEMEIAESKEESSSSSSSSSDDVIESKPPLHPSQSTFAVAHEGMDISRANSLAVVMKAMNRTVSMDSLENPLEKVESPVDSESGTAADRSNSVTDITMMAELMKLKDDTEDVDDIQESDQFDTRQSLLNLCQGNHYQFDQLRRAKHSSMMLLYHLQNPDAPKFVPNCSRCHADILTGNRFHCEQCDIDFCQMCVSSFGKGCHNHQLRPISTGANVLSVALTEEQKKERQKNVQLHLQLLLHTSSCNSTECSSRNCAKMKQFLQHGETCPTTAKKGCNICKRIQNLLQLHSRQCRSDKCSVSHCQAFKDMFRSLAKRQQIMDDRRRAMMNEMYNRQGSSHGTSEEREA